MQRWHTEVMANREHLAKLKQGVEAWNLWRENHPEVIPDLSVADLKGAKLTWWRVRVANLRGAIVVSDADLVGETPFGENRYDREVWETDLVGADFHKADLVGADLKRAILSKADLSAADLVWANLFEANLTQAELRGADLSGAHLSGADLVGANLFEANLTQAELRGADLRGARVGLTKFTNVDLRGVKGLETVVHCGPSTIGIDTIYKSKGKIPHVFLRGCGVPENFIESMAELVGTDKEFYSLFISYATHDQAFAARLYAGLQAKGVRCWFAPHALLGGQKTHRQIDEAIRMYDKLLLILSPASMESEWVRTEIAIARKREKEQKKEVLFPISLCPFKRIKEWEYFDSDIGRDSAREIREYHIPNFTKWKTDQDAYQREFDKLLKALNEKPKPVAG